MKITAQVVSLVWLVGVCGCGETATAGDAKTSDSDVAVVVDSGQTAAADVANDSGFDAPADSLVVDVGIDTAAMADSQVFADTPAEVVEPADAATVADAGVDVAETATNPADTTPAETVADALVPPKSPKYGFVSLLTGKAAVVDLDKMKHLVSIGQGSKVVHGIAVVPGQNQVYVPSNLQDSLDLYETAGDPTQWQMVSSHKAPILLGQVRASDDCEVIAASTGEMPINKGKLPATPQKIAIFRKATGGFTTLTLPSAMAISVAPKGDFIYVGNWLDQTIMAVSEATNTAVGTWPIPKSSSMPMEMGFGPSCVQVSHDGKWVASANLFNNSATVFNAKTGSVAADLQFDKHAHWVAFSANDSQLYVVLWGMVPNQGDEMGNVNIPTRIAVIDLASQKEIASIQWDYLLAHVAVPNTGNFFYATGSWGTVLKYDAQTFALVGQAQLAANEPMPAMTMGF